VRFILPVLFVITLTPAGLGKLGTFGKISVGTQGFPVKKAESPAALPVRSGALRALGDSAIVLNIQLSNNPDRGTPTRFWRMDMFAS
jgi:hypothetical protein